MIGSTPSKDGFLAAAINTSRHTTVGPERCRRSGRTARGARCLLTGPCGIPLENRPRSRRTGSPKRPAYRPLPPYLLAQVEAVRAGGDIPVSMQFTLLAIRTTPPALNVGSFSSFVVGGQDPPFEIPQSRWAKLLDGIGASAFAILEIPIGKGPVPAALLQVVQRLEEARVLLSEGKTDEVVTKCRKALEALNPIVSVTSGAAAGPPFQRLEPGLASKVDMGSQGQPGKDPKSARLEALRESLWSILHIGPHDGYDVFPEDAKALFWLTSGLVRYYAELIARP
jgi:hypothetical protein